MSRRTPYARALWPPRRWRPYTRSDNTLDERSDQHVRETKTEALAVLDDAMLFLRGGIDALQDK